MAKAEKIDAYLDREHQVIRQVIRGDFDLDDARLMVKKTDEVVKELDNPADIRVLLDARTQGHATSEARDILKQTVEDRKVARFAT